MRLINFIFWTVIDVVACSGYVYLVLWGDISQIPIINEVGEKDITIVIGLLIVSALTLIQLWSWKLYKGKPIPLQANNNGV